MTTSLTAPLQNYLTQSGVDNTIILRPVSWSTFNQLLEDLGDHRGQRLAFDGQNLEIMSPLGIHENSNRLIDDVIRAIADELGLNLKKFGSLTLRRERTQQGVEPDSCYYLGNEPKVRGKQSIDLTIDPPPDLVLEIDITSSSLDKFPVYASLGVPEVWRYDGVELLVFVLNQETKSYQQVKESPNFPCLTLSQVPALLQRSLAIGETAALKEFRQWFRGNSRRPIS